MRKWAQQIVSGTTPKSAKSSLEPKQEIEQIECFQIWIWHLTTSSLFQAPTTNAHSRAHLIVLEVEEVVDVDEYVVVVVESMAVAW